jgi:hypothetical protein
MRAPHQTLRSIAQRRAFFLTAGGALIKIYTFGAATGVEGELSRVQNRRKMTRCDQGLRAP